MRDGEFIFKEWENPTILVVMICGVLFPSYYVQIEGELYLCSLKVWNPPPPLPSPVHKHDILVKWTGFSL